MKHKDKPCIYSAIEGRNGKVNIGERDSKQITDGLMDHWKEFGFNSEKGKSTEGFEHNNIMNLLFMFEESLGLLCV